MLHIYYPYFSQLVVERGRKDKGKIEYKNLGGEKEKNENKNRINKYNAVGIDTGNDKCSERCYGKPSGKELGN